MNNTETMKQVYLLAQEHCGLKVGDWVKVTRGADGYEAGWPCNWNNFQTNHIHDIGKITDITQWGLAISFKNDNGGLCFPFFILEKVEKPAHEFKPFDKVLVRDSIDEFWKPDIFCLYDTSGGLLKDPDRPFVCIGDCWYICIPYKGNEHLVGTTDEPEE